MAVDISRGLRGPLQSSPNLPVLTRGSDTACILQHADGAVMVPHATIAALREQGATAAAAWQGNAGSFDLWVALMNGAMLTVGEEEAAAVAAA